MTMPYRPTAFRKQTHSDFSRRARKIDRSAFVDDTAKPHVFMATALGFGWAYMAAAIGGNRTQIETWLRQGDLSADVQHFVLSGLAAAMAATLTLLFANIVIAIVTRGARRKNSRSLILGAMLAFALFYTPDSIWQLGYSLMDGRSQDFLQAAGEMVEDTFPSINIDRIRFASSSGM